MTNEKLIEEAQRVQQIDLTARLSPGDGLYPMSARGVQTLRDMIGTLSDALEAASEPQGDGFCVCNGDSSGGRMRDCGIAAHRAEAHAQRGVREPQGEPSTPCTVCGNPGAERSVVGKVMCDSCVRKFNEWAAEGVR